MLRRRGNTLRYQPPLQGTSGRSIEVAALTVDSLEL
jgi:hypothetical protein